MNVQKKNLPSKFLIFFPISWCDNWCEISIKVFIKLFPEILYALIVSYNVVIRKNTISASRMIIVSYIQKFHRNIQKKKQNIHLKKQKRLGGLRRVKFVNMRKKYAKNFYINAVNIYDVNVKTILKKWDAVNQPLIYASKYKWYYENE